MQRRPADPPPAPLNVVVLMLESWDAAHVDALRVPAGRAPLGATPNFDALSREGASFSQCYASGQRSMDGLSALLAGIPTLPGIPYLGRGMEQNDLSCLGPFARSQGYQTKLFPAERTAAVVPGRRHRAPRRLRALSRRRGHPRQRPHARGERARRLGLRYLAGGSACSQRPGRRSSASCSPPPRATLIRCRASSGASLPATVARRAISTRSITPIGRSANFFAAARQSPYYRNTLVILAGDHVSGLDVQANDVRGLHHIPCLVLGPKVQPGVIDYVASQLDVLPTVIDRTHWPASYASLGRLLFDAGVAPPRCAATW